MTLHIPFDNTYARLPERMFAAQPATTVSAPSLIAFNHVLAAELCIDTKGLGDDDLAGFFSGNSLPMGATPLAQAYGGHQFGNWNPGLGDGRALLLGEVVDQFGQRRDIALKGSGPTPFSRAGDGRAALGPVLREYLISEAMQALGVPTTRALAAVLTGDQVWRDTMVPGAILTRVAASHIRVGTFQLFAARGDIEALQSLTDHVIARHFPGATGPADLLNRVIARQAHLIAQWSGLGFVHGVMNTDNMAVSGETIDYGPCAFIDGYHPDRVFSSIDRHGRYAYSNQPHIAVWNLAQFATALIPLMPERDAAIDAFTHAINQFPDLYDAAWQDVFAAKLGLLPSGDSADLAKRLLEILATEEADFTRVFANLATGAADQFMDRSDFETWEREWSPRNPDRAAMANVNPQIIPRTHHIESVIASGIEGDFKPFHAMLAAVTRPFDAITDATAPFSTPPLDHEIVARTFCGT